jgi:hypothetical protein
MRKAMVGLVVVAALAVVSQQAVAQANVRPIRFGVQGSWASDNVDFGVGARVVYPALGTMVKVAGLEGYASFDFFFPGNSVTYWELNPGVTYNLALSGLKGVSPYVGGGLNVAHISVDLGGFGTASDTKMGLNVLGGGRFGLGKLSAFAEARYEIGGGERFVATFGILF